jgi:hypothetical protein
LLAANAAFSQVYTNSPSDSIVALATMDELKVCNISQLHSGTDTLHLKWRKLSVSSPLGWDISLCDYAHCYTTLPDTGSMDPVFPGDVGLMSLHVTPHTVNGTATIVYALWDASAPSHIDTLTWVVSSANTSTTLLTIGSPTVFAYGKNVYINNTGLAYEAAIVYDIESRVVARRLLNCITERIALPWLPDGVYTVRLSARGSATDIKIMLTNQ